MLRYWHSMVNSRIAMLCVIWALGVLGLWGWQCSRNRALAQMQLNTRQIDQLFESKLSLLIILDRKGCCLRISETNAHFGN